MLLLTRYSIALRNSVSETWPLDHQSATFFIHCGMDDVICFSVMSLVSDEFVFGVGLDVSGTGFTGIMMFGALLSGFMGEVKIDIVGVFPVSVMVVLPKSCNVEFVRRNT